MKKSFVIIDAYGFLFRAYYALPSLSTSYGMPIGGVYGFISILLKHLSTYLSDYLVVVFDSGTKNFRHAMYPEYKSNRAPLPEELIKQFAPLREVVQAFNIASEEVENYEADDVIATLSAKYASDDITIRILTADKDMLQLIGKNVHVYDPIKSRYLDNEYVIDKFGVSADKLLDALALTGDASDNVPGVPSIGIKTAAKLISEFGSLDNVLRDAEKIEKKKCREMLIQHADQAILSRNLISLYNAVDIGGDLEKYVHRSPDVKCIKEFLEKYELASLTNKVERYYQISLECVHAETEESETDESQEREEDSGLGEFLLSKCEYSGILAVHTTEEEGKLSSISVAYDEESVFTVRGEELDGFIETISPILRSESILKVVYDAKSIMRFFPEIVAFDDIMIMFYTLDAAKHDSSLDGILLSYLKIRNSQKVSKAKLLIRLHRLMKLKIFEARLCTVYYALERPLIKVIYDMERVGVQIDMPSLKKLSDDFSYHIHALEEEIYDLAGCRFNIASSQQLGKVLFENLRLGKARKMFSGVYCTNADVLGAMSENGEVIADKILKWRHFTKLKSTYTDALMRQSDSGDRIHTSYSMVSTVTGRVSSSNPNLQNIPIRSKEGGEIRKTFVARPGYKLVSADYSQMELRIMAHIADVKLFKQAFSQGEDIHYVTAQQMFAGREIDEELRRSAKSINFGILYGMGVRGLSRNVGLVKADASEYMEQYFRSYPEIKRYMQVTKAYAKKYGYTTTVFGRKCFISGINSSRRTTRSNAERAAINAPIQGTAADIFKKAMIAVSGALKAGHMVMQVHDELVVEVPENEAESTARLMKEIMESVVKFSVHMETDVSIGDNWGEMVRVRI